LAAGEIGFESDTGKIKIGTGSTAWNALAYTASSTAVTYLFNATAAQTTFSGADANGLTLAYTAGAEQVYLNGALQVRGSDYTATNGTSIVLTSGALVNDVLNVIAFSALALSDTYTQAQADAKFFQNANAFVAGKNKIINGDFYINQRQFTSTTTDSTYGFDRFYVRFLGDGTNTYSAQNFTPGTAPVGGYEGKNFARLVTTGQTTSTVLTQFSQRIESVRTFAGQTITISFWAKAASGTPKIAAEIQQGFGSGGSPSAAVNTSASFVTVNTSWTRYSLTVAVPSISGKTIGTTDDGYLQLAFGVSAGSNFDARYSSIGIQTNTFDIWGVQLEAGSIATPFQTATGTIQGELAACQRYYYRNSSAGSSITYGNAFASTGIAFIGKLPQTMRVSPTSLDSSTLEGQDNVNSNLSLSSVTLNSAASSPDSFYISGTVSGATQFRQYALRIGTSGYVGFSAEL
jgi:hypothetical protein